MMRREILKPAIFVFLLILVYSCHSGDNGPVKPVGPGKDEMADLNRYMVQKDREIIQSYIERKKLEMKESPTGLWYMITAPGTGEQLKENDRISMNYECDLLDGTRCYSSDTLGVKEVIIGKSKVEQGLNEGLKLLKRGSEAVFIIPPFLAYGLLGDGKKIPPRAIIIYKISIGNKK
jgi:FKBP-type peptidyl-prolyl cis-trans isomerase FkpA